MRTVTERIDLDLEQAQYAALQAEIGQNQIEARLRSEYSRLMYTSSGMEDLLDWLNDPERISVFKALERQCSDAAIWPDKTGALPIPKLLAISQENPNNLKCDKRKVWYSLDCWADELAHARVFGRPRIHPQAREWLEQRALEDATKAARQVA